MDQSADTAHIILSQQRDLQARIEAIEKQRELLKYRMVAQNSVGPVTPIKVDEQQEMNGIQQDGEEPSDGSEQGNIPKPCTVKLY